MKKKMIYLLLLVMISLGINISVKADYEATVINPSESSCNLYSRTSTGYCFYKDSNLNSYVSGVVWMDTGEKLTVLTDYPTVPTNDSNLCSDYYVYASHVFYSNNKTYYGYYCHAYLTDNSVNDNLKEKFKSAGFPESYWSKLAILQQAHPNWNFVAVNTGLNFNDAVYNESLSQRSLLQVNSSYNDYGYLSTDASDYNYYTDEFVAHDGYNWYSANSQAVAYYMDPRNFLIDMAVFQFEALSYVPELQTIDVVHQLLSRDFLDDYAESYMTAGRESNVSPVFLASLSKNEVGGRSYPTTAVSGNSFTYNNQTFSGIYNPYNIGATSGPDNVYKGLYWASGSVSNTYMRPWNSMDTAIRGGAIWIGENYIHKGQNTIYFKKFNVVYNYLKEKGTVAYPYSNYNHQYMTNIQAPFVEGKTTYFSYYNSKILDSSFVFYIPVYNNMPESTELPVKGNPNNFLKTLKINSNTIASFDGAVTTYNYYVDSSVNSLDITAETVNSNAKIDGLGTINLVTGVNTKEIIVTAQNGSKRKYTINIIKEQDNNSVIDNNDNNDDNDNNNNIDNNDNQDNQDDNKDNPSINEEPVIPEINVVTTLNNAGIKNGSLFISGIDIGTKASYIKNKVYDSNQKAIISIQNTNQNDKNDETLVTGDIVNIKSGSDNKSYTIVIYGDVSGDGAISAVDYVLIKNNIMGKRNLGDAYKEAADVNRDGVISAVDYVKIKNSIMGKATISQ